jgi:hypothetical protein
MAVGNLAQVQLVWATHRFENNGFHRICPLIRDGAAKAGPISVEAGACSAMPYCWMAKQMRFAGKVL